MSFLNNLVSEFVNKGEHQQQAPPSGSSYGYPQGEPYAQQGGGYGGPQQQRPQVPYPWVAEWDQQVDRWVYINRETGYRSLEFPGGAGGGGGGYPQQQQGYGYGGGPSQYRGEGGYAAGPPPPQQGYYAEEEVREKSHTGRNVALGAAGGLLGGALLMHEGEKVEENWDEDKSRFENDVSDFPDEAAAYTGRKVQEVEDIPQDVEHGFDDVVQDVEDVPDDVAGWAGRDVGRVERWGDGVEGSYDEGRAEERYDDDY